MSSPVQFGDTITFDTDGQQDYKDMCEVDGDDAAWDSWTAEHQDDNQCLTFKRMLPKLGPKPPPPGA